MKMDDLVRTLAEDGHGPRLGFGKHLVLAIVIGSIASAVVLVACMGLRPDMPSALKSTDVQLKFAFAIILSLAALFALIDTAQPDAHPWRSALPIAAAPALLIVGAAYELMSTPVSAWLPATMGTSPGFCLTVVPLIALPPLIATINVMRRAAPASPARAGALMGLLSGGIGAGVYMLRCTDDAPLFVATWYVSAIAITCILGILVGRSFVRW